MLVKNQWAWLERKAGCQTDKTARNKERKEEEKVRVLCSCPIEMKPDQANGRRAVDGRDSPSSSRVRQAGLPARSRLDSIKFRSLLQVCVCV